MTLFQHTGGDPRVASAQLADVLAWYGAVGDAAFGNAPGFALRKASVAVALASTQREPLGDECDAMFFAGLLHAVGAIKNPAFRKNGELDERTARTHRWDVPAQGARECDAIGTLPPQTADLIRWQSECWDGTGFPDQLRWYGIPKSAQYLALADALARCDDPEEALGAIAMQSGRAFGPEYVRSFVTWFHANRGEARLTSIPLDALDAEKTSPAMLLDRLADDVDEHNAVPGRWRRIEKLTSAAAQSLQFDQTSTRALALAVRLFGSGEIAPNASRTTAFHPLSRLGIDARARNAARAAALAEKVPAFHEAAKVLAARAEWFDGTGKPKGRRGAEISQATALLAAAIAYDKLDRSERLDTAAGTQFDPAVIRAVLEVAKTRA